MEGETVKGFKTIPGWVSDFMPWRGECGLCGGPDARHRVIDAMAECVRAGDDPDDVAADFGYPVAFVNRIMSENIANR